MKTGRRDPLITLFSLLLVSCANPGYGPGSGWGHMMNDGFGGAFMGVPFLILMAVVIYFVVQNAKAGRKNGQSPLDILKSRYAGGEITKEEFGRMKKDIDES